MNLVHRSHQVGDDEASLVLLVDNACDDLQDETSLEDWNRLSEVSISLDESQKSFSLSSLGDSWSSLSRHVKSKLTSDKRLNKYGQLQNHVQSNPETSVVVDEKKRQISASKSIHRKTNKFQSQRISSHSKSNCEESEVADESSFANDFLEESVVAVLVESYSGNPHMELDVSLTSSKKKLPSKNACPKSIEKRPVVDVESESIKTPSCNPGTIHSQKSSDCMKNDSPMNSHAEPVTPQNSENQKNPRQRRRRTMNASRQNGRSHQLGILSNHDSSSSSLKFSQHHRRSRQKKFGGSNSSLNSLLKTPVSSPDYQRHRHGSSTSSIMRKSPNDWRGSLRNLNQIIGKLDISKLEEWDSVTVQRKSSDQTNKSRPLPQNSSHRFTSNTNHAPYNILSVDQAMFDRLMPTCLVKSHQSHRERVAFDFDVKKEWKPATTTMSPGTKISKKLFTGNHRSPATTTTTTPKTKIAVIPLVYSPTLCVLATPTRQPNSGHVKARRVFRDPGLPKQELFL
jgi:hypothetical protein